MNNYKIIISYDGKHFHGFQKQTSNFTVQQAIEIALDKLLNSYQLTYAGRTDSGVHAKQQVLSVVTGEILKDSFKQSLNALVGEHIFIKKILLANKNFHPRYDAIQRTYKYFINTPSNYEPYNLGYSYFIKNELKISELNLIADSFLGENNFTNYSKLRIGQNPVRELTTSKWTKSNQYFIYTITGNSFLHNMVRSIVGVQLALVEGKVSMATINTSLKRPLEERFKYVVPADGLYLWKIKY